MFCACSIPKTCRARRGALTAFVPLLITIIVCSPRPAHASALTLDEALQLASQIAPQLTAQRALLTATQDNQRSASELPDPKLLLGVDNLPTDGADRWNLTREGMTMRRIGLMQEFTRPEKLRLRGQRADAESRREAAQLELAQVQLRRDVALAWIDRLFAERQRDVVRDLAREFALQADTASAALAGGKGLAADPLMARAASVEIANRLTDAERQVSRSQANLIRWLGAAATRELADAPAFDRIAHSEETLRKHLDNHPQLALWSPTTAMAEADFGLAAAARKPDWSLEVTYAQRGPAYTNMLSVGVRIDLPIFQTSRQDPAVSARLAMVNQTRALAEDATRAHRAEVESMWADWVAAKERLTRFDEALVPLAREREAVVLAAYAGGKAELPAVLETRRAALESRLGRVTAQADLARAWAALNFLLPEPPK